MAAVSVLRIVGPSVKEVALFSSASFSSLSVNPPSGPMKSAISSVGGLVRDKFRAGASGAVEAMSEQANSA